jgi:hypothetical protein
MHTVCCSPLNNNLKHKGLKVTFKDNPYFCAPRFPGIQPITSNLIVPVERRQNRNGRKKWTKNNVSQRAKGKQASLLDKESWSSC